MHNIATLTIVFSSRGTEFNSVLSTVCVPDKQTCCVCPHLDNQCISALDDKLPTVSLCLLGPIGCGLVLASL